MVDETKIDGIPVYEIYKNLSIKDMTGEEWKDIEGYEGLYMVSNYGRVKSLNYRHTGREHVLTLREDRYGYIVVHPCKDGNVRTYTVHRLVAKAFIQNPYNKPEINHISEPLYDKDNKDLSKRDNRAANLEWCDSQYNNEYSKGKKIICVETNTVYPSSREAERQTGINQSNIVKCCQGNNEYKTAGKLHWKYTTQE